jgi:hypothetical protein
LVVFFGADVINSFARGMPDSVRAQHLPHTSWVPYQVDGMHLLFTATLRLDATGKPLSRQRSAKSSQISSGKWMISLSRNRK